MSDLLFRCQACSKNMAVTEVGVGKVFPCPDCQEPVTAPEPSFYFECHACKCMLCAPEELVDALFQCPNCGVEFQVPQP